MARHEDDAVDVDKGMSPWHDLTTYRTCTPTRTCSAHARAMRGPCIELLDMASRPRRHFAQVEPTSRRRGQEFRSVKSADQRLVQEEVGISSRVSPSAIDGKKKVCLRGPEDRETTRANQGG
jgi:hypothetical protein